MKTHSPARREPSDRTIGDQCMNSSNAPDVNAQYNAKTTGPCADGPVFDTGAGARGVILRADPICRTPLGPVILSTEHLLRTPGLAVQVHQMQ